MEKGQLVDAPSFVDLCTLHQHAMRYYRLWIYACNTVLALATLIFTLFALSIAIDPRISLLSGVELYQPTFLYAYIALILQCGVLQTIGCIGALRLNQKLLNTYWTLLLILMIGDIFVGLVWAFRLDKIKSNLRPTLKTRLSLQYENDSEFTKTWDWVQKTDLCCGVDDPKDFVRSFNDSSSDVNGFPATEYPHSPGFHHPRLPHSCCVFTISYDLPNMSSPSTTPTPHPEKPHHHQLRTNKVSNPNFTPLSSFGSGTGTHNRRKILHSTRKHDGRGPDPSQNPHPHRYNVQTTTEGTLGGGSGRRGTAYNGVCVLPPEILEEYKNHHIYIKVSDILMDSFSFYEGAGSGSGGGPFPSPSSSSEEGLPVSSTTSSSSEGGALAKSSHHSVVVVSMTLNSEGCGEKLLEWVDHASDVLFVIGFCIIVFVKGCFVAILRYEIKEMIQKIKLLNGDEEGRTAAMNELIGLTSMYEKEEEAEEDPGEQEGLMQTTLTTATNLDAIESDKRKDSVISRDHHNQGNCLNHVGNHVRNVNAPSSGTGNHVPSSNNALTTTTAIVVGRKKDPEEDFSAPLGKKAIAISSSSRQDDGANASAGRSLLRNGNNNTNTTGVGGVTGSASAPIPIDSMAKA